MLNIALRPGAFCVTINVWDIDLEEFLDLKKKQGEDRLRGHNLYTAINFDDVFMSRLDEAISSGEDRTYTLFDPYDVKVLCDKFGEDFKNEYIKLEEEFVKNPKKFNKNTRVMSVREIARKVLTSYCNTGFPYWTFIDTINNNHEHPFLGKIRTGNLCVSGDTKILTKEYGYKDIRDLEGEIVSAWNGKNYSKTPIFNTGKGEIYEVSFNYMPTIKCTEEHKFHVLKNGQSQVLTTVELKEHDAIEGFYYPKPTESIPLHKFDKIQNYLNNVGWVKESMFNSEHGLFLIIRVESHTEANDIIYDFGEIGISTRFFMASGKYMMVVINFDNIVELVRMGFVIPEEVKDLLKSPNFFKCNYPPIRVKSVINTKKLEITYCGTEPEHNKLMFNGILTGNCQEVVMPADDDEIAVCNLGSINLASIYRDTHGEDSFLELLEKVTEIAMRFLDNSVDVTVYPHPNAEKTQRERRSTGLGVLGEAEFIAHQHVYFGSEEHLEWIDTIYGTISRKAYEASKALAEEKGSSVVPGLRNLYRMCIAPNTSSGIFASTTAGCEPVYAKVWIESKQKINSLRMTAPNINVENYKYYQNAFEIDQKKMITASARRQKYIDMSISHSIFKVLDENAKASEILSYAIHAWKEGLKSIYYLRSKQPTNDFLNGEQMKTSNEGISCVGCAN